jgi:hypothetical protein
MDTKSTPTGATVYSHDGGNASYSFRRVDGRTVAVKRQSLQDGVSLSFDTPLFSAGKYMGLASTVWHLSCADFRDLVAFFVERAEIVAPAETDEAIVGAAATERSA